MAEKAKQSKEEIVEVTHAETESIQSNTAEAQEKSEATNEQRRTRLNNTEFFSRDILGASRRDRLLKPVSLKTRTGQSLYRLTYDRLDAYLHRPKEVATLIVARDANNEMEKLIGNRLTELENFVNKRFKTVSRLYEAATAIEKFELDNSNVLDDKAGFSSGHANRYLSILEKIDEICYMAGYLEKIGQFDIRQESNLTSELYRKAVEISRRIMVFIARAIRAIRRELRQTTAAA